MKNVLRMIGLLALIITLLTVPGEHMGILLPGNVEGESLDNDIFPICIDHDRQDEPAIHENLIVWEDERLEWIGNDIFMYDLNTETESRFSNMSERANNPEIYHDTVVWDCYNDSYEDQIIMQKIGEEFENISAISGEDEEGPLIHGDYIVWFMTLRNEETWESVDKIVSYRISTGEWEVEDPVIESLQEASFSHGRVAWTDLFGGSSLFKNRLYVYNITTNQIEWEFDAGGDEICITEDMLTYFDNLGVDLYEMDLVTGKKKELLHLNVSADSLDRYGNIIVWSDERDDPDPEDWDDVHDIYLYDVENKIETQITSHASDQKDPVIHGNIIVWVDERNGNEDIYAYDLTTDSDSNGVADYIDKGRRVGPGRGDDGDDNDAMIMGGIVILVGCALTFVVIIVGVVYLMDRKKKSAPPVQGPIQSGPFQPPYYQPGGPQYPGSFPPAQVQGQHPPGQYTPAQVPGQQPPGQYSPAQLPDQPPPGQHPPTQTQAPGYPPQKVPVQSDTQFQSAPDLPRPAIPTGTTGQTAPHDQIGQGSMACPFCRGPARSSGESGRHYCDRCQRYID